MIPLKNRSKYEKTMKIKKFIILECKKGMNWTRKCEILFGLVTKNRVSNVK